MGHEIGVTAVQAAAAYACIANGGEWVKPHLVSRVTTAAGDLLNEHQPERRQVVSETTAATLKAMLEGVVVHGTGKAAQMGSYSAAGKRARRKRSMKQGDILNAICCVVCRFCAGRNPKWRACFLDEPRAHLGGTVSAPVFARVVADALRVLEYSPNDPQSLLAGDFKVYDISDFAPDSQPARSSDPVDSRPSLDVSDEAASVESASKRYGSIVMPDLIGKGIREAVKMCAAQGLILKAAGDGVVSLQSPSRAPGPQERFAG
jgi:hypothetical protein